MAFLAVAELAADVGRMRQSQAALRAAAAHAVVVMARGLHCCTVVATLATSPTYLASHRRGEPLEVADF